MGVLNQLGLLLKQNLIERKRRWGITLLELGWPIALFIIIVAVRDMYPATDVGECKYEPRAMPSAGVLPFMQSYMCNLNSKPSCSDEDDSRALQSRQVGNALTEMEEVLLDSEQLFVSLSENLEQAAPILSDISQALESPQVQEFLSLSQNIVAQDLFRDPEELKSVLLKNYGLKEELIDTIFNSKINLTNGAELLLDIDADLCNSSAESSPLSRYLVLPASSTNSSMDEINNEICSLDAEQIAALLDELQRQLDTNAIFRIVKQAMSAINPDISTVIKDIETMLGVLGKLKSFQGLAKELPNIGKVLDLGVQILQFIKQAQQLIKVTPKQIGQFINQIDPLITQWSNNSQIWQDIKRGIFFLDKAVDWITDTVRNLPNVKLSFGNVFTDGGHTLLDHFNLTIQDTEFMINVLSKSSINVRKLMDWQAKLMNPQTLGNSSICDLADSYFETIDFPSLPADDQAKLDEIMERAVRISCIMQDVNPLVQELLTKLNINGLLNEFAGYANSTVGSQPLDWENIIQSGWNMVETIIRLRSYFDQYAPLFNKLITLDITKIFASVQKAFTFDPNQSANDAMNQIYDLITNFLDVTEGVLRATPAWQYVRPQLVLQNMFGMLVIDAFNMSLEATNLTKEYFDKNKTTVFVNELMSLDESLRDAVIAGLTTPHNVRKMLDSPQLFADQLQNNLTGLLDLNVDSQTEQTLTQLFGAGGDFVLPEGLSLRLTEIGDKMRTKINHLVDIFTVVGALNAEELDDYARLSGGLNTQRVAGEIITEFTKDPLFRSSTAQMGLHGKYMNVIPYAILSTIMETMGPELEKSDAWDTIYPYMHTVQYTADFIMQVMDRQDAMIYGQNMIGRVLDWAIRYGPHMMTKMIESMKDQEKTMYMIQTLSSNPAQISAIVCDSAQQEWFFGSLSALDSIPMDALKSEICIPGFEQEMYNELMGMYDVQGYIVGVATIFNSTMIGGYDSSMDWIDMSKTLTDMPNRMNQTMGKYAEHYLRYNWTAWAELGNVVLQSLMSADNSNPLQLVSLIPSVVGQFETMFGNTTEWMLMEHIIHVVDVAVLSLKDRLDDIYENGLTLSSLFENSTRIKEYLMLNSQSSPILVDALFDNVIDPMKALNQMMMANFTDRMFCTDLFVSDFITFRSQSESDVIDKMFCGVDWEALWAEIQTDKISGPIAKALVPLMRNQLTDLDIDYKNITTNMVSMIQSAMSMSNFTGPIMPEIVNSYNISINSLMVKQQEHLKNLAALPITHWTGIVDQVTEKLRDPSVLNEIGRSMRPVWSQISYQVQINLISGKMILQQIRSMYSAARDNDGEMSLANLVLPGELRKALEALESSPEMTDTLLYSLIQLLNNPAKLMTVEYKPELLDDICNNQTVYEYFFSLPPGSNFYIDDMQYAMCSLRINVTALVREAVSDIEGLDDLLTVIQEMGAMNTYLVENLFTDLVNHSMELSNSIEKFFVPINEQGSNVTFNPPRWVNRAVWMDYAAKWANYTTLLPQLQLNQAQGILTLLYALGPTIDGFVNTADYQTRRALTTTTAVMDFMVGTFAHFENSGYNDTVFLDGLEELSTVNSLYKQLPEFVESITMTALTEPTKLESFIRMLSTPQPGYTTAEIFCAMTEMNFTDFFVKPAGNNADFYNIKELMCTAPGVNGLLDDLRVLTAGNSSYFDNIVRALNNTIEPPMFSMGRTMQLGSVFYTQIQRMVAHYSQSGTAGDLLVYPAWMRVIENIYQQLQAMASQPFDTKLILNAVKYIDLNVLAPEVVPYIHTGLAVMDVAIRKLQPLNSSSVDLLDFVNGYPELTKAMRIFNISRDAVELIMMSGSSVKLQRLVQTPPDQILPTLCADDWTTYFNLGPDPVLDLASVKSYVCTTNWTAVYNEIITDLEVDYIQSQLSNNSTLEWTAVFDRVDHMIDLVEDIQYASPRLPMYLWLNETLWSDMMTRVGTRLGQQFATPQFAIQTTMATLVQVAPMIEQLIGNRTDIKEIIWSINVWVEQSAAVMQMLEDKDWSLMAVFDNTTEIKKLIDLADELPGYVDMLLQTMLEPEKIAPMINELLMAGNDSMGAFCAIPDLSVYVVHNNQTYLNLLQDTICSGMINFTVALQELTSLLPALDETPSFGMNSTVVSDLIVSLSMMSRRVEALLYTNMTTLERSLPYWVQPNVWINVINKFTGSLNKMQGFDVMRLVNVVQTIMGDMMFGEVNIPELNVVNAVLDVVVRKLELFNRTEINITTIFENAPETVKSLDMLRHLSDVVEILISSGSTPQFQSLFTMGSAEVALTSLCSRPVDTYLKSPAEANIDLQVILSQFCQTNWTIVAEEVMSDVSIDAILAELNNTAPVNMSLLFYRSNRLSELIQYIIAHPPHFVLDPNWTWLNATVWEGVLSRLTNIQAADLVTMVTQSMFGILQPMFGNNPEFQKFGVIMEALLSSIKTELNLWNRPGQNLTVGDVLNANTNLNNFILEALDLTEDLYALLVSVSLKNPGDLQMLFQSPNPQALLCDAGSTWMDYVSIPPEVNVTAVEDFICSTNFTVLLSELMQRFNIDDIIIAFQPNATVSPDWTKINEDIRGVVDVVKDMMTQAPNIIPPFNPENIASISNDIMQSIDWNNAEIYLSMSESMMRFFRSQPFWPQMEPYFQISTIIQKWVSDLMSRLKLSPDMSVNIGDLFPNATMLNEYLSASLAIDEQTAIKLITGITMKPHRVVALFLPREDNSSAIVEMLCDPAQFADLFSVPADASVTDLSQSLCNMVTNSDTLLEELSQTFKVGHYIDKINAALAFQSNETFSIRDMYNKEMAIIQQIMRLANASDVMYNNIDLREKFALFSNETHMQRFLVELTKNLPAFELTLVGDVLNQLTPLLRTTDWWNQAEVYFKMMNVLAEVGANRTSHLPTVNLTLNSLIRSSDKLRDLLQDSFQFTPDLIRGMLNMELTISPADLLADNSTLNLQDLICSAKFPSGINETAVRIILCGTDFQVILDEILSEFDFDIVIQELGKIDLFTNASSDFDWNDLLTNTNDLAQNLAQFFTGLRPPPVQQFFMYDGNMTEWVNRIIGALEYSASPEANFKRIAATLKSMESLFSNYPEYRQVIMVSQIIQNYLDVAISELNKYTHTVSLNSILRNNTKLIELVSTAFDATPDALELLMTQPINAQALISMLANPATDPCTMDMTSLFVNASMSEIVQLQNLLCNINFTVMAEEIRQELDMTFLSPLRNFNPNATSFDWGGYMQRFTDLSNIIGQMVQAPPTISPELLSLLNVSEYMTMFDRVQKFWMTQQFKLDPNSFASMMNALTPLLESSDFGRQIAKFINVYDIIASRLGSKLQDIKDNDVSLNTLLGDAPALRGYLENIIQMTPENIATLLMSQLGGEALLLLVTNRTQEVCSLNADQIIVIPEGGDLNVDDVKKIFCQANFTAFLQELSAEFDISRVIETLSNNGTEPIRWASIFNSTQQMVDVITYLASNDPKIDQNLLELFNMTRFDPVMQSLAEYDPRNLLKMLDIYSPLVQHAAGESWPIIQNILYYYTQGFGISNRALSDLVDSGMTMESLLTNRTALRHFYTSIMDESFGLADEATFDMFRHQMALLLPRQEIQDMVCNETALQIMTPNRPAYVDLKAVLCGVTDDSWVDNMKARNYSALELNSVISYINRWYVDEAIKGVYNWTYINVYGTGMNPAAENITLGALEQPIRELIDVLSQLGSIPPQMLPGFNMSYWMPMIESLGDAFMNDMPVMVLRQLEMMEPLLRDTAFWGEMRTALTAASQYMSWINDKLEEIDRQGKTISIVSLLPDIKEIEDLLKKALSPGSAAEFLTIAFQPAKLVSTLQSDPSTVLCDPALFNQTFTFPAGMDVVSMQSQLCDATQGNGSLVLQDVWKMFDLKQLATEITRMTGGMPPAPDAPLTESPFRTFLKQFQRILKNASVITRLMQAFNREMPDIASYLQLALSSLSTYLQPNVNNIGGVCDAVVSLVDKIPEFDEMVEPYLVNAQLINSIIAQIATSLDNVDDFMCEFPSMNISTLLYRIASSDLMDLSDEIILVNNQDYLKSAQFRCSKMIHDVMVPQEKIQHLITDAVMFNGSMQTCFRKLLTSNITIFNDVNSFLGLLGGLRDLLMSDALDGLAWLDAVRPLIDQVITSLLGEVQGSRFEELFNQTAVDGLLDSMFNSGTVTVNDFLGSVVDVDKLLSLLNMTFIEAQPLVCNASSLGAIIPGPLVELDQLSQALCSDPQKLSGLLQAIKDNLNQAKLKQLADTASIEGFISSLLQSLQQLIDQFSKIISIPDLLTDISDFNLATVRKVLPKLQSLMASGANLDALIDSILGIVNLIETRIPGLSNSTEAAIIFSDIRLVLNGVRGLKTLRNSLMVDIPFKSVVANPTELEKFLLGNTMMTEENVRDLIGANFTSSLFTANMDSVLEIREKLCDPDMLPELLELPKSSKLTYEEVSDALCIENPELVVNISLELINRFNVSEMIATLVTEKLGLSMDEVQSVVETMAPLQQNLTVALDRFQSATAQLNLSSFVQAAQVAPIYDQSGQQINTAAQNAASTSSLYQMMCGGDIAGYEAESSALDNLDIPTADIPDNDETERSQQQTEVDYFSGPYNVSSCDKIRQSMYRQKGGQLLWKYIKPLFVGKILYTPNNAVTREIVSEANSTFNNMARLLNTVKSTLATQKTLTQEVENLENLQNQLEAFKNHSSLVGLVLGTDLDLNSLSSQLDLFTSQENQMLLSALGSVAEYAECVSLNRFEGVDSEAELESAAARLHKNGEFIAGLVIMNTADRVKRDASNDQTPEHIRYKIRMDIDNVEQTLLLQELFYSAKPRDDLLDEMRYMRGFLQIQEMVDRAIIKLHTGSNMYSDMPSKLQMMPATCYQDDIFMGFVYPYIVPVVMTLAWLFAVAHCIKTITAYRECGLEELMQVMGLRNGVIWWSWFINTIVGMALLSAIATIFIMVGKVLLLSNGFIVFLYLLTFSLSTTMFCYMVSAFFTNANVAAAIGVMLFVVSYLPYVIYTQFRVDYNVEHLHASSLLSTTAFAIGATYISRWEQIGQGINWDNINKVPGYNESSELTVQWMFCWMLIDSAIYFLIGWYFRNVIPGKFGFRQPLYFPFTKSYWVCGCGNPGNKSGRHQKGKHSPKNDLGGKSPQSSTDSFSSLSLNNLQDWKGVKPASSDSRLFKKAIWPIEGDIDLPVGISIQNLRKVYKNGKVAVDGLNLDFSEGHVTAFLGRNGAGKTTTINMLTGMTSPSSGAAEVNGYSVNSSEIGYIRQNLGYCPQFNMLFDFMTVKEHLVMFASLKSDESSYKVECDVEDMLHNIGLWSMRDELVGSLSGGMQRRLSVAIAFIGNSKVIILDEPTSSIDPHGRRVIWDVILKYRTGRTILLCTHHLDEADTLGDKVVIIDKGKLRAEGSPMSLKKQHASGYQLFLEKKPATQGQDCDAEKVTVFIKQHCPEALLMTDIGSSLTYTLPTSQLPKFDQLFSALNENLSDLGISGFGVSDSTLDEVFEKITDSQTDSTTERREASSTSRHGSTGSVSFGSSNPSGCGAALSALFKKRFLHTVKDYKTYFSMILLPCLFVALALGVTRLMPDRSNQPNLELQTSLYPNTYSFYSFEGMQKDTRTELTDSMFNFPGLGTVCMGGDNPDSDKFSCSDRFEKLTTASNGTLPLPTCSCPKKKFYSCEGEEPKLDSFVTNTSDRLIHIAGYDLEDYLLATDPQYRTNRYGGWSFENSQSLEPEATVWYDNRAYHSSPSYLNALSNMLLRAAVASSGSAQSEYGITVYNHPLTLSTGQLSIRNALEKTADLGVSLTFLVAFSFVPAGLCIYLVLEHTRGEKHLQYVSGVGAVRYWFISYFWDLLIFMVPIGLTILLMYAFGVRAFSHGDNLLAVFVLMLAYAFAILPFMYMTVKGFGNTTTSFFILLMLNLFIGITLSTVVFLMNFFQIKDGVTDAYLLTKKIFLIFPQYSFTSALIQLTMNQALVDIFSGFDLGLEDAYHPFNPHNGIHWNIIALVIAGVVFFIITLLTEIRATNCDDRISSRKREADVLDDDVQTEKRRLYGSQTTDSLTVRGLSKQYRLNNFKHILAVKDVTFGVSPGEIFGLCGVNGAGKTSTFKMLTGELTPSEGEAQLHNIETTNSSNRRRIGYCPQINSLDVLLTGRQTLQVYAQLKGIDDVTQAISNIMHSFGMETYIEKQVKDMSGGMKRNLCVAVALLGDPELVFLDEPSAGMDPVARRVVWNQILAASQRGAAVVLTSHSMTECEALCSRIAIMLNGKFACLGSSQHLKNKFGLGYTLKVKVSGPLPHTQRVVEFVKSKWPQAQVKDQHLSTTEFSIPQTGSQTLGELFTLIEKARENLYIEEYSVFQTTLDQVFIQFARQQHDQVEGSSASGSEADLSDPESSNYQVNLGYATSPDQIVLSEEEKTAKTLDALNGDMTWNTYL